MASKTADKFISIHEEKEKKRKKKKKDKKVGRY